MKDKSTAKGGLERASEPPNGDPTRSRRARDGHRFESFQLHHEVLVSGGGSQGSSGPDQKRTLEVLGRLMGSPDPAVSTGLLH
jgi:hypothetical protein